MMKLSVLTAVVPLLSSVVAVVAQELRGLEYKEPSWSSEEPHIIWQSISGENTAPGMVTVKSTKLFEKTYDDLLAALNNNPAIGVVAKIDHSADAKSVGLKLNPNRLVVFGNPNLGTPIMQENQKAGLDLPQKMLVWEDDSANVFVGYNSVEYIKARYPGTSNASTLDTIARALANLASAATGVDPMDIEQPTSTIYNYHGSIGKIGRGLYSVKSDFDFDTTLAKLTNEIGSLEKFTVDHQANSGNVLRPTTLVVFGNPNIGTPLMQESATTGIDLPLKILVWENRLGKTVVTTNRILFLKVRHNLGNDVNENLLTAGQAVRNFINSATQDPDKAKNYLPWP